MGITRIEDLVAFQRAVMFKEGIYTLVRATSSAYRDRQWRRQIFDSAMGVDSNSAEGWISRSAAQICQFLDYAHASLDETRRRSSYVLGRMGRTADAREVLRDLEQSSRPIPPYEIAGIYAGLGDADGAIGALEKAYAIRDVNLVSLLVDPTMYSLRAAPRFQALVARCAFTRKR